MDLVAIVLTLLVAAIHVYIVFLEMVLWTRPRGRAVFGLTPEFAEASKALAANQGLYNGFLAAGLFVGCLLSDPSGFAFRVFFLSCVAVAGLYGAATVSPRILAAQTVPAVVALAFVVLAH
ncbi:DUF1304 domain-containing protein [Spongisporangium articulatum]|uniref:DUF1304 domain-containing protein n=1 Tax=Spongisporangium articulatum TaxID=3362603 RepID=A0ABW8ARL0_9ACTN